MVVIGVDSCDVGMTMTAVVAMAAVMVIVVVLCCCW